MVKKRSWLTVCLLLLLITFGSTFSAMGGKSMNTIFGTDEDELVFGSRLGEKIYDLDGDDVIKAGGGNDIIVNSFGNDRIYGQAGDDYFMMYDLFAFQPRAVRIDGGSGNDTVNFSTDFQWNIEQHGHRTVLTFDEFDAKVVLRHVEHITYDGEQF